VEEFYSRKIEMNCGTNGPASLVAHLMVCFIGQPSRPCPRGNYSWKTKNLAGIKASTKYTERPGEISGPTRFSKRRDRSKAGDAEL
jgi:hypothetical protein